MARQAMRGRGGATRVRPPRPFAPRRMWPRGAPGIPLLRRSLHLWFTPLQRRSAGRLASSPVAEALLSPAAEGA
jgi:hypothetical protein